MADTIRTRSGVISILPDNTSGDISPQDLRDLLVSAWGVYGGLATQNNLTVQTLNTSPTKLLSWGINLGGVGVTTNVAGNEMSYNTTGVFLTTLSLTCAGMLSSTRYTFSLAVNGSAVSGARAAITPANVGDVLNVSISFPITISTIGDTISVLGESDDAGGQDVNVVHGQLFTYRIF